MAEATARTLTIKQHQEHADKLLQDGNASFREVFSPGVREGERRRYIEEAYLAARLAEVHLHAAQVMIEARAKLGLENASGASEAHASARAATQAKRAR